MELLQVRAGREMGTPGRDVAKDISQQISDALGRLQSKQLFQTTWDIVAFAIFFTFIGMVLLLGLLALIRCCCCDCDAPSSYKKVKKSKIGIDNMGMEP